MRAKPSAAARPGAAVKGGSGVSTDNDATQHALAQKKARLSGQTERSGGKGTGVSPGYGASQHAHAQKKAKLNGQAERSREGGFGGISRLQRSNSDVLRRGPSRAQQPGQAQL
jgi:hypothetical protein